MTGHTGTIRGIHFSNDGKFIVTAGSDNTVRIWDATTFKQRNLLRGHENDISASVLSPDGKWLATVGFDAVVRLWDIAKAKEKAVFKTEKRPGGIGAAFSPDGKTLAVSNFSGILFWDVVNGKELRRYKPKCLPECVAFTSDGKMLLAGGVETVFFQQVGVLRLFHATTLEEQGRWMLSSRSIMRVQVSPTDKVAAFSCGDKKVLLWDLETKTLLADLRGHADFAFAICFSPDGKTLASGSIDGLVILWNARRERK